MKYKVRAGGFTIADWIRAEKCNDKHFQDDITIIALTLLATKVSI